MDLYSARPCVESCGEEMCPSSTQAILDSVYQPPCRGMDKDEADQKDPHTAKSVISGCQRVRVVLPFILALVLFLVEHSLNVLPTLY
jgi:hypothetical protein